MHILCSINVSIVIASIHILEDLQNKKSWSQAVAKDLTRVETEQLEILHKTHLPIHHMDELIHHWRNFENNGDKPLSVIQLRKFQTQVWSARMYHDTYQQVNVHWHIHLQINDTIKKQNRNITSQSTFLRLNWYVSTFLTASRVPLAFCSWTSFQEPFNRPGQLQQRYLPCPVYTQTLQHTRW